MSNEELVHPVLCEGGKIPNLLAEEKMALLCCHAKEATHDAGTYVVWSSHI